jgi:cytochrome c553
MSIAMRRFAFVGLLACTQAIAEVPSWAYGYMNPPAPGESAPPCPAQARPFDCAYVASPVADDGVKHRLPDSSGAFTRTEAYFDYGPADWYPGDHPVMPDIVARGRQQDGVRACALCHYPNGQGKMENGGLAGLPLPYFLQQLEAFKQGARRSADPRKANVNEMARIAASLTDAEAQAAARYFTAMPWRPWVRVVESAQVPRVRATTNGLYLPIPDAPMEPIGIRIIEMPEQPERTERLRDPRSGFVAYAPPGSIARGEALAVTGGGRTLPCASCHGTDLRGIGEVPGIAGRSPSYLFRQLYDVQRGTRHSPLMTPVVAQLTAEDMVNITAYVASRKP